MSLLKRIAVRLPRDLQFLLESFLRLRQVKKGDLSPGEPEYELLPYLVQRGDWVLDIGANIGHYTLELSRLVGDEGRVVALEPMARPMAQLAGLVARLNINNITLFHAAASERSDLINIGVPRSPEGLLSSDDAGPYEDSPETAFGLRVDDLGIQGSVTLIKVHATGYEIEALRGMETLIRRCRPVLIVEDSSSGIGEFLFPLGYLEEKLTASPNCLFWPVPPDYVERLAEVDADRLASADS